MKVEMDLFELEEYLKYLLKELQERMNRKDIDITNAGFHDDLGKKQAIEDILSLINLYGEDFYKYIDEVKKKRFEERKPEYDEALDLMNEDSWWIAGYNSITDKIEISETESKNERQTNQES